MANLIYNEEALIDNNIFQYEKRIHSPVVRMQSKNMVLTTYWHINNAETTTDAGWQDVQNVLGDKSPIKFNRIEKFPLYEMEQINLQMEDGEAGIDMNHEGDATIIPGTIKPLPNSFFMINHLKEAYVFRVTEVTIDNVMPDNYYKIHYRLEYLNSDMVDRLNSQTTEVYSCILDNIGTEERCIVEKESQVKIKEIEKMLDDVKSIYLSIFYSERYNVLLGDLCAGEHLYDPLQSAFINKNDILNSKRDLNTIILSVECEDSKFRLKYNKSIYKFIENPDRSKIERFYYDTFLGINRPETQFNRWLDSSIHVLDIPQYMDPLKKKAIFTEEFVNAVRDNRPIASPYGELLRKYICNKTLDIRDIPLDLNDEMSLFDGGLEVFFTIPLLIYVIKKSIDNYYH